MTDLGEDGDRVPKILVRLPYQTMAKVRVRLALTSRNDK
jgi:hypothetical protein